MDRVLVLKPDLAARDLARKQFHLFQALYRSRSDTPESPVKVLAPVVTWDMISKLFSGRGGGQFGVKGWEWFAFDFSGIKKGEIGITAQRLGFGATTTFLFDRGLTTKNSDITTGPISLGMGNSPVQFSTGIGKGVGVEFTLNLEAMAEIYGETNGLNPEQMSTNCSENTKCVTIAGKDILRMNGGGFVFLPPSQ